MPPRVLGTVRGGEGPLVLALSGAYGDVRTRWMDVVLKVPDRLQCGPWLCCPLIWSCLPGC